MFIDRYILGNEGIRAKANLEIEKLRAAKKIGKSIECGINLHVMGRANEVGQFYGYRNTIETCLNVSDVLVSHTYTNEDVVFNVTAFSMFERDDYVQCNRCWKFHTEFYNFDNLCNRCARVMCEMDHWTAPYLKKTLAYFNANRSALNTRIKPNYKEITVGEFSCKIPESWENVL